MTVVLGLAIRNVLARVLAVRSSGPTASTNVAAALTRSSETQLIIRHRGRFVYSQYRILLWGGVIFNDRSPDGSLCAEVFLSATPAVCSIPPPYRPCTRPPGFAVFVILGVRSHAPSLEPAARAGVVILDSSQAWVKGQGKGQGSDLGYLGRLTVQIIERNFRATGVARVER